MTIHDGFDYWLDPAQEITPDLKESLEEAASTIIPTEKLAGVESAYLADFGARRYLRWSMAVEEDRLIDAIARLHAKRQSSLGKSRFLGAFRSSGICVPVWDVFAGTTIEQLEADAEAFAALLTPALQNTEPLDSNERRARAGIIARQVTLR